MIQTIFRWVLIAVTALIAALLVAGFMSDAKWRTAAEVNINAPINKVYEHVATLNTWPSWTAWNTQAKPNMSHSFSGANSGEGARYQWFDGAMHGEISIHSATAPESINYRMDTDDGEFSMDCGFSFADGSDVQVQWACWGDAGANPVARLMMRLYAPMMRKDLQTGLNNLKARLEQG